MTDYYVIEQVYIHDLRALVQSPRYQYILWAWCWIAGGMVVHNEYGRAVPPEWPA